MPPNKMERFTQRARRVLSLAQEAAERLRHNYIGTEHLLLGLMREEGGVAGRVLRDLGLEDRPVEDLVEGLTRDAPRIKGISLDLTSGTKRVLELAVDEARRMGHHYIGTEHMLLGLVRQSDGVHMDVLKRLGVSPEEVRRQTRRVLQESPVQHPQAADRPTEEAESSAKSRLAAVNEVLVENATASHTRLFSMMFSVIVRVLNMIEENKLTTAQGAELLGIFVSEINLTPSEKVQLASHFKRADAVDNRRIHLTVTDKTTDKPLVNETIRLDVALQNVDVLFSAILNNRTEAISFDDGSKNIRMEIQIEEDK